MIRIENDKQVSIRYGKQGQENLNLPLRFEVARGKLSLTKMTTKAVSMTTKNGGALLITGTNSAVWINSCQYSQHEVSGNGGALAVMAGRAIVHDTRFDNNKAGKSGGAIYVDKSASVQIERSTFRGNSAVTGNGGALSVAVGSFTLAGTHLHISRHCTFLSNHAGNLGQAIYIAAGPHRFDNDDGTRRVPNPLLEPTAGGGH